MAKDKTKPSEKKAKKTKKTESVPEAPETKKKKLKVSKSQDPPESPVSEDPDSTAPQEESLAESFTLFTEYCLLLLKKLRDNFPVLNTTTISRLEFMLRCLNQIQNMEAFKAVCPFRNELHLEIATVLKKGTLDWYEKTYMAYKPDKKNDVEQLRCLVKLSDAVHEDVEKSQNVYNKLFVSIIKVDYFSITYRQLEKLVADEVSLLMESLKTAEQEEPQVTHAIGESLFELYITLSELRRFRDYLPLKDNKSLALSGFHELFKVSIHMWLLTVHEKTCERIHRAVELDKDKAQDEPNLEDLTPEERRVLERKLKKQLKKEAKRLKREEPGAKEEKKEEPAKPSAGDLALQYLKSWSEKVSGWKFQKLRQTWLLMNMYDQEKVPDEYFSILLDYLGGLQGAARETTIKKAEAFMKEHDEREEEEEEDDSPRIDRIREVLQLLS